MANVIIVLFVLLSLVMAVLLFLMIVFTAALLIFSRGEKKKSKEMIREGKGEDASDLENEKNGQGQG